MHIERWFLTIDLGTTSAPFGILIISSYFIPLVMEKVVLASKKLISTSEWCAEQMFAGRNTQQFSISLRFELGAAARTEKCWETLIQSKELFNFQDHNHDTV